MNENLVKEICGTNEFQNMVKKYFSNMCKDYLEKKLEPNGEKRKSTMTEDAIIFACMQNNDFSPLKELYDVGCDLNSVIFPMENQIYSLFSIWYMSLNDDQTCDLIDVLKECNYDFNERTLYNGGNYVLSCALGFKPKATKKLIDMGISCNVTNETLDTVYNSVKDMANYVFPKDYDEILKKRGIFSEKEKIINSYKDLLKFLDKKGINGDISDPFYDDLNKYLDICKNKYSLNDKDFDELKRALYGIVLNVVNSTLNNAYNQFVTQ